MTDAPTTKLGETLAECATLEEVEDILRWRQDTPLTPEERQDVSRLKAVLARRAR